MHSASARHESGRSHEMPAYHSAFNKGDFRCLGNIPLLPIRESKGPAPALTEADQLDVVDEALYYFRANVLFRSFEVNGDADRVLAYLTLFISQCLQEVTRNNAKTKADAQRHIRALSTATSFAMPGDAAFPLSAFMTCGAGDKEALRAYMKQLRGLIGERLLDRICLEDGSLNKWWMSFQRKKFMNKALA